VSSTCYRKLRFTSQDSTRPFRLELYVSPDFRFLTRELLDSRIDPIEEARQKQQALEAGLTRGNFPALGPPNAPVTLAVFSDFQCPYCARMAQTLKEVLPAAGDRVRLVYRYFPLPMHPWARPAAEAAACAQEQGNNYFWTLHDFIFEHQREFTPDSIGPKLTEQAAGLAGLGRDRFTSCLANKKTAAKVQDDVAFATANGINATPTLFLNGQQIRIVASEQLLTLIRELSEPGQKGVVPPMEPGGKGAPAPAGAECAPVRKDH